MKYFNNLYLKLKSRHERSQLSKNDLYIYIYTKFTINWF